jgi:hypothetical protein
MATLVHRIRAMAAADPGRPALFGPVRDGWRQLSRGAWWSSIRQAANGLSHLGLPRGDAVVMWAPGTPEWAVVLPAVGLAGCEAWLVAIAADDDEVVRAVQAAGARWVVVDGADRLERVLALRESGRIQLEHIVVFERLGLGAPRLLDLEELIEHGASVSEGAPDLSTLQPEATAIVNGDQSLSWGALEQRGQQVAEAWTADNVIFGCDPAEGAAVTALAGAIRAEAELWMAPELGRLLDELPDLNPGELVLGEDGWKRVRGRLERAADDIQGVRGGMAKVARRIAHGEGPAQHLLAAALRPAHEKVGVCGVGCWSAGPLPAGITAGLDALGRVVQALPSR